jgi:hypothetical protein
MNRLRKNRRKGSAVEGGYIDLTTTHVQVKYQGKNPIEL